MLLLTSRNDIARIPPEQNVGHSPHGIRRRRRAPTPAADQSGCPTLSPMIFFHRKMMTPSDNRKKINMVYLSGWKYHGISMELCMEYLSGIFMEYVWNSYGDIYGVSMIMTGW